MEKIFRIAPDCGDAAAALSATVEQIRLARREAKLTGGVIIEFAAGVYTFERGVVLTEKDSGTADKPLVIRAAPGATARFAGSRAVDGFVPVTNSAILSRLLPEASGALLQCDLYAQGIADFGVFRSRGFGREIAPGMLELFYKGKRMRLTRWPKDGFTTIKSVPSEFKDEHGGALGRLENGFFYDGERPMRWSGIQDIIVHGYWAYDWANSYERIASLDPEKRHVLLAPPGGTYGFRAGQRIQFLNILEELNEPGLWYQDRQSGILYFWPPAPLQRGDISVSMLEDPFITVSNASHIRVEGLGFEAARGSGIRVNGGKDCRIKKCSFLNLGNYAVVISGGVRHVVEDSTMARLGDGGVDVSGGDRKTLTPANHAVCNNHIHNIGEWSRCYVPAVMGSGVGIRIANNLIHDHPHCAILFGGNGFTIEFNEIHDVCLESGDVGVIYIGRDYTFRDNVVRHNFIHHIGGVGMGSMGIYNDDCVSGTAMFGNVFWKAQRAVFLGGGRDFKVENNIFVDCEPAVALDGRGLSTAPVWHNMVFKTMKERLDAMNWREPPYAARYPELAELVPFYEKGEGIPPGNIKVARNICVGGNWKEITWGATPEMIEFENNLVNIDPQFVDPSNGNFELKPTSPAFKLGFEKIPMRKIGLQRAPFDAASFRDKI